MLKVKICVSNQVNSYKSKVVIAELEILCHWLASNLQ